MLVTWLLQKYTSLFTRKAPLYQNAEEYHYINNGNKGADQPCGHLMLLLYVTNRTYVLFMSWFPNLWYFKPIFAFDKGHINSKDDDGISENIINVSRNKKIYSVHGSTLYCMRAGMRSPSTRFTMSYRHAACISHKLFMCLC